MQYKNSPNCLFQLCTSFLVARTTVANLMQKSRERQFTSTGIFLIRIWDLNSFHNHKGYRNKQMNSSKAPDLRCGGVESNTLLFFSCLSCSLRNYNIDSKQKLAIFLPRFCQNCQLHLLQTFGPRNAYMAQLVCQLELAR